MFVKIIMEFSIDFLFGIYSSVKLCFYRKHVNDEYRCRGFNYGARTVMCALKSTWGLNRGEDPKLVRILEFNLITILLSLDIC